MSTQPHIAVVTDCVTKEDSSVNYVWGKGEFTCNSEIKPGTKLYAAPVVPASLVADFQEFLYRAASQVQFEHAAWAHERGAALMEQLKQLAGNNKE